MQPAVPAADVAQRDVREVAEERAEGGGRKHVQMRGIVLRRPAEHEAKPPLHPEGIRNGPDDHSPRTENAERLGQERLRELQVLEQLPGDDCVEARIGERKRLLDVRLHRLDAERLRLRKGSAVDVEPDDLVVIEEVPGQRARPAAEIEYALSATNRSLEDWNPLGDEDEVAVVASLPVVLFVPLAEVGHA